MVKKSDTRLHFNVIDFLLIVILATAICAIIFSVLGSDMSEYTNEKHEIRYTLSLDDDYASNFALNQELFTEKGKSAGTVTEIVVENEILYITVTSRAYDVYKETFIKGQRLTQGGVFTLKIAGDSYVDALCTSVN